MLSRKRNSFSASSPSLPNFSSTLISEQRLRLTSIKLRNETVLVRVGGGERQQGQFGDLEVEKHHHLAAIPIRHSVEGFVADQLKICAGSTSTL